MDENEKTSDLVRFQRELLRFAAHELLMSVVPAAQSIGAVPADVRLAELQDLARQDFPGGMSQEALAVIDEPERAKERVRVILGALVLSLDVTLEDCIAGREGWQDRALQLLTEAYRLAGYIDGVYRTEVDRTAPAAKGRTTIGQRTNAAIVKAAAPYRRQMLSREEAAPLIAEKIGKGESTVQKKLSMLFPGQSWRIGRIDDTP
ncbi:MAG: hypothetical protein IV107_03935 [Paucibacter sp.]|nr:hypothetical protein [Roseateles sp.]